MNASSGQALSASRGNRFGIGFFRLLLRCGAFGFALWFSRIVTWFYARFDRRAFAATEEYLKLRFPEDATSEHRLKRHFHKLLNELAKTLLISYRMGIGETLPLEEEHPEFLPEQGGVVVVLAHYDCWQAAMELMHRKSGRRINIMASPDRNGNMDKFLALKEKNGFKVISTDGFSGGLVEASAALERGEAVIVMGDRPVAGAAAVEADYLGGKLAVPLPTRRASSQSSIYRSRIHLRCRESPPRQARTKRP